jgi:hypothetical protein
VGSPDAYQGSAPILVTGVPRSGTTWLARLLATAAHTSMPGREPMNPRGRQFALGGTLQSWVRRESFAGSEAAVLRRAYAGREPRTFSRYGIRQWAAPLPGTRLVIKDPFALLSTRAIHDVTGAIPVLLYRHPAAVLASYRRMGWTADVDEFLALGAPHPDGPDDLDAMATMWAWCHEIVLKDIEDLPDALVVSHHDLTVGGADAHDALFRRLGLEPGPTSQGPPAAGPAEALPSATPRATQRRDGVLHDFDRTTDAVDTGWRDRLDADEIARLETATHDVWSTLQRRRIHLPTPTGQTDDPS